MSKEPFEIKRYTKAKFANLYSTTVRTMTNWINKCCIDELKEIGYKKSQHHYSSKQVEIIVKHIDEP